MEPIAKCRVVVSERREIEIVYKYEYEYYYPNIE